MVDRRFHHPGEDPVCYIIMVKLLSLVIGYTVKAKNWEQPKWNFVVVRTTSTQLADINTKHLWANLAAEFL